MPAETREPERYRIADLIVDVATRQVTRGGRDIQLPGLSFDLLLALIRRAPGVVSADELMDQVWPGRVVNAETVAKRVELVREALGDDSHEPRYIALVRGHGYRLVESVQPATSDDSQAIERPSAPHRRSAALRVVVAAVVIAALLAVLVSRFLVTRGDRYEKERTAAANVPSVAVLPFVNLSDDASNVYFSDGISEELLTALSKLPELRVASRTSSFAFRGKDVPLPEIARTLNVGHIVEGSVRKAGNRIRIAAQLIEVESDSHIWAEVYDRQLEDIFAVQKEISENIVTALKVTLGTGERAVARSEGATDNLEAYQLYLRGRHVWQLRGENNIRHSIRLFTRSIELDPNFARAHAALAQAYVVTTFYYQIPDERALDLAARSAARAIELDPTLSEPYAAQGQITGQRMDWSGAEAAYRRAIELNGNDATARYWLGESLSVAGRTRDALPILLKALELDPISSQVLLDVGYLYMRTGAFDQACPYFKRATDVGSRPSAWLELARCHEHRGDVPAAEEAERTAERLAGIEPPVMALVRRALQNPAEKPAALAAIRALSRRRDHLTSSYWILGDLDGAFDAIEAELRQHNFNELRALWDDEAKDLRAHPRFRALVERIGLVSYWRDSGWPDLCRPAGASFVCD